MCGGLWAGDCRPGHPGRCRGRLPGRGGGSQRHGCRRPVLFERGAARLPAPPLRPWPWATCWAWCANPVAGLVEVPCVKRNVVGAVNAVSCANMALAGIDSAIPCDEVIDAMGRVGRQLSPDLRETGAGGLAATPTGRAIARRLAAEAGGV